MKKFSISLSIIIGAIASLFSQSFNLTVNNGYGSGSYQAGDTVHIWSEAFDNTKHFIAWSGDSNYLEMPHEWHTTLIMPNKDISVTATIANMPAYTINNEKIMGVNNLKNVYSCFPPNLKGVIYFFHGTGGSASNWINIVEYRSLINEAIASNFGVIVTEAEEITLNKDLNNDGKLRWLTFPIDTLSGIDYLNIKTLTDTFINRGNITPLTPKFSIGMSNGGSFSAAISYIYQFKAGVSYCASSVQQIFSMRNNPFAFRMAKYDDNPEVGPQGNYEAWQNDSILNQRGICHNYQVHDKQPIYPERFARINGISVATSKAMFNELFNNKQLDSSYFALPSDTIKKNILASPSLYPTIAGLTPTQRLEALNQISTSNAEHSFYSDFNYSTLQFIGSLCSVASSIQEINNNTKISVFPNPAKNLIVIVANQSIAQVKIFNLQGQEIKTSFENKLNIEEIPNGNYFLKVVFENNTYATQKILKE